MEQGSDRYEREYRRSRESPDEFWLEQARLVDWHVAPKVGAPATWNPPMSWFADGVINTCHNAVDRHVEAGHGDRPALVFESPVTGIRRVMSYASLQADVASVAGGLRLLGVGPGDRVLVYMPMIPEAVVAMLASARLGAVHTVVFGGFAARELAARIDDFAPTVILYASGAREGEKVLDYVQIVRQAMKIAKYPVEHGVVVQRPGLGSDERLPGHADWEELLTRGWQAPAECVPVAADAPLYVLYTSGTTARPKGIVRDNGGHAVAMAWSMANVFDIGPGDVMWAASDIGWVVGHSYIVYGPLIAGATTILYEGKPVGTPDAGEFWRVIERRRVNALFAAPTAFRAIRREDPDGKLVAQSDLTSLRTVFMAGERLDPETHRWAGKILDRVVVDNWWQTETGWPIAANPRGLDRLPIKEGSPSVPMPGYDVRILDDAGLECPTGVEGSIYLKLPLPPGALTSVWGDDDRFVASYLHAVPGHYATGDGGFLDDDGYLYVMGRTDDLINVAGHRLSVGALEAAVGRHPAVAECAVVGVRDGLKGERPHAYVIARRGIDVDAIELGAQIGELVRREVGTMASLARVRVVSALPKTRSGKILRRTIRQIVHDEPLHIPGTIEDLSVVDQLIREVAHDS